MTPHRQNALRRIGVVLAGLMLWAGTACSEGGFANKNKEDDDPPEKDTAMNVDTMAPDTGTADTGGSMDAGDTQGGDADTSTPSGPKTGAFTSCAAGGVSEGGGVRAVQCFGPVETSSQEATGGGVRWQPGAFRVITE